MFFRLRTKLLLSGGLTLALLLVLAGVMALRIIALRPAIARQSELNVLSLQARDLSLRTQAASADLNAALTGVSASTFQAQNFDRQLTLIGATLGEMRQATGAGPLGERLDQLQALRADYLRQGNALFSLVAQRLAAPTPENRDQVAQALAAASRVSNDFNQRMNDLGVAVSADLASAENGVQEAIDQLLLVLAGTALGIGLLVTVIQLRTAKAVTAPVSALADAAQRLGAGDLAARVEARGNDEVGALSRAFNAMAEALLRNRAELEEQNQRLETTVEGRTAMLQSTISQLEESFAQQTQLQALLRGASTPVLPVARGVLLMPLIGTLEGERAGQAVEHLLASVAELRSSIVILDVTGLSVIDTQLAALLLRAARAVRLLGAQTLICGINPEVAQALVHLDAGIDALRPVANLQAAVALALRTAGRRYASSAGSIVTPRPGPDGGTSSAPS
ncbi:MAG TPA: HAMP domain-containing protein [Herpetosiphonaceae bacterium]